MKRLRSVLSVVLVLTFSLSTTSCEVVEQVVEDCLECLCGDITEGNSGITGNAKVDAFFQAVIELDASTRLVDAEMQMALANLAISLGLEETASLAEIQAAIADVMADVTIVVKPARCETDIDVAVQASAECDVTIDPGEVDVVCEGRCEGTCYAECNGECRLPSVEAFCEGECYGSCYVESTTECYGNCHGTCAGECSYMEGGECAGACTGACTGYCETRVNGDCEGGCYGECAITADPGGCDGYCEGECTGHCEGHCEGEIRPPSVDADCEASVNARVEASVECYPPEVTVDGDAEAIANYLELVHNIGLVYAASAEAERIHIALAGDGGFVASFDAALEALINGEVPENKIICALDQAEEAALILNEAVTTLNAAASVTVELDLPPLPTE